MTAKTVSRRRATQASRRRGDSVRERPERSVAYLDASALVKLLLPEAGSTELNRVLAGRERVLISDLAVTETTSALARRRREGVLTGDVAAKVHRKMLALVEDGFARAVSLDPAVHRRAERLLLTIDTVALRAADALHLALALSSGATIMASYDERLTAAATQSGLLNLMTDPYL